MSPITKTIKESLEEFNEDFCGTSAGCDGCDISRRKAEFAKLHLLQSQIKVIEAVIESLTNEHVLKTNFQNSEYERGMEAGRLYFIDDQISSLSETLEELKKSL